MAPMFLARPTLYVLSISLLCCAQETTITGLPEEMLLADEDPGIMVPGPTPQEPEVYAKANNIWIDSYYLGGRAFSESRDEISSQLGPLVESRDLGESRGQELEFSRGTIRVADDRIAMIRVPLAEPMRRSAALQTTGFPILVDTWINTHRYFRLNHEWGFRRLRLKRLSSDSEFVTEVEAWKWIPGEHGTRR